MACMHGSHDSLTSKFRSGAHERVASEASSPRAGEPRAVVFLDVDGVLCCNSEARLEAAPLRQLRRICDTTGAQVVLSSDWRRNATLSRRIAASLEETGVGLIGETPQMEAVGHGQRARPREIAHWLSWPPRSWKESVSWVVLDDRDLLAEEGGVFLRGRHVRTFFRTGLTAELADRAIATLLHGPAESGPGSRNGGAVGTTGSPRRSVASLQSLLRRSGSRRRLSSSASEAGPSQSGAAAAEQGAVPQQGTRAPPGGERR